MRGQWTRGVGAIVAVALSGCVATGLNGPGASASDSGASNSGSGNSSQSESGSGGSNNSSAGSGQSGQTNSGSDSSGSSESSGNSTQSSQGSTQSSEASAEATAESSGSSRSSQGSYSPVLSATLGGATAVGLGFALWNLTRAPTLAIPPPEAVAEAAQTYLRGRTHQLREDLMLGAGPTLEDLAAMAGIRRENLGRFGRRLREHRGELLALAQGAPLTPARALAWLGRVGEIAHADPRLREDRLAFARAHGLPE